MIFEPKSNRKYSQIQMLMRYKAWVNEIVYRCVLDLPDGEAVKVRQNYFKSIAGALNHLHVVEGVFKAHLEGRAHSYQSRTPEHIPPVSDLWEATQKMNVWYIDQADNLSENELSEVVEFEFIGGGAGRMTRWEILQHIVTHNTYHQGFISSMLYQIPASMPANDLPVFLREVWVG